MPKLTRKEALVICRESWQIQAKTGSPYKAKMDDYIHQCVVCSYVAQKHDLTYIYADQHIALCKEDCPLINLWPDGCVEQGTVFDEWSFSKDKEERMLHAQKIVDACDRELYIMELEQAISTSDASDADILSGAIGCLNHGESLSHVRKSLALIGLSLGTEDK